jgi:predicted RNA-binding Zn ribbon-like protein
VVIRDTVPDTDVDLVLDFLNTLDVDAGTDLLDDPAAWRAWLATRELTDSAADTAADKPGAKTVAGARAALRAAAGDVPEGRTSLSARITVSLDAAGPRLVAGDVVGAVLAAASRLAVLGEWDRVKICPASDCRWAFYDRSRNHSRTWCSMRVCGNREKARAWRERARAR